MIYSTISCCCILMLIAGAVYVLINLVNKVRKERVEFVRTFKNGRCIFVLIPTFFIVLMGLWYDSASVRSLLSAIPKSMQFVVMGFELGALQQLMNINMCYALAVYLDCFLIIFNACMVVVSIFKQRVHYTITNHKFCTTKADIVLILGNSEENSCIYSSVPQNAVPFVCCPLSKAEMDDLYNRGIEFLTLDEEKVLNRICSIVKEPEEEKFEEETCEDTQVCNVFINTGDDTKNILLANNLLSRIKTLEKGFEVAYDKLAVYIFGSSAKQNLFLELEEKGFGCFHYVDEYKLAVLDLIENHPMASFFDSRHVDFDTTLVKNVELRVFMIGFGETNTELFLRSVSNDQFVTTNDNGAPVHKAVKYYLFDKKKILENSNLNYSYNSVMRA